MRLAAITLIATAVLSHAAEYQVRIAWDPHHPAEGVAEYQVTLTPPAPLLPKTIVVPPSESPGVEVTVDDAMATTVTVTASNAQGLESEPSEPLVILPRPSKPGGLRVLRIETSDNLRDWKPMASVAIQENAARAFFRAHIDP